MKLKNLIPFPRLILTVLIFFGLNACIDPYDVKFGQDNKVLVVEGLFTNNLTDPDTIKIQHSYFSNESLIKRAIPGTQASIVSSSGQETKLISVGTEGGFLPPASFRINPAEKYTLKFSLSDGNSYESTPQQMLPTPSITKVYDVFNSKSKLANDGKTQISSNEVYVDFQDTPNQKNNYMWRYTHYEKLVHCITCDINSLYVGASQSCVKNAQAFIRNPSYDYQCSGNCYRILKNTAPNVLSDITSDGRLIKGKLVAKIPVYSLSGCLVVIDQMVVSPEIFDFNRILESQSVATGGLADTPPAAIVGNIRNLTNSTERVVGYFGLADIKRSRYWVSRNTAQLPIEHLIGHVPLEEPPAGPKMIPLAPCKKSATRTNVTPEGWL
jgi:Domain of unknown function (DUF4249)